MRQYWIVVNKSGVRSVVFNFETAKDYADKGYKVVYVAEEKEE